MESVVENKTVIPFLRWTGSKRWFTKSYIEDFLPAEFDNYHEPFLGAGYMVCKTKGNGLYV